MNKTYLVLFFLILPQIASAFFIGPTIGYVKPKNSDTTASLGVRADLDPLPGIIEISRWQSKYNTRNTKLKVVNTQLKGLAYLSLLGPLYIGSGLSYNYLRKDKFTESGLGPVKDTQSQVGLHGFLGVSISLGVKVFSQIELAIIPDWTTLSVSAGVLF